MYEIHFGKLLLKQSDMVLTHLTPVTLTFDPVIPKSIRYVPLLPMTDVWTKFEEGRSMHFWVIDWKRFWQIWPRWPWPLTQWPQNQ